MFPFPSLFSVVLLDTTAVLGELDWKTYPVNGVSDIKMLIQDYLLTIIVGFFCVYVVVKKIACKKVGDMCL